MHLPTATPAAARPASFDLNPVIRGLIATAGAVLSVAAIAAVLQALLGRSSGTGAQHQIAVMVHLTSVLPAIPLGMYVLLTRKGTARHKLLGRIWLVLMVVAALSAMFIQHADGSRFSWLHLFVPITLLGAYKTIATARARNIAGHKRHLITLYLIALIVPGIFAFLPSRLMGSWLFG